MSRWYRSDRGENIPSEDALNVAKIIKEKYCYVCPGMVFCSIRQTNWF